MDNDNSTTQGQIKKLATLLDAQHARIPQAYQDAKACADVLRMNEVMQDTLVTLTRKALAESDSQIRIS